MNSSDRFKTVMFLREEIKSFISSNLDYDDFLENGVPLDLLSELRESVVSRLVERVPTATIHSLSVGVPEDHQGVLNVSASYGPTDDPSSSRTVSMIVGVFRE